MERAVFLIKPDAIGRGIVGRVLAEVENHGYMLNGLCQKYKDDDWLLKVFGPDYGDNWVREAMIGAPLIGFIIVGEHAHDSAQQIVNWIRQAFGHSARANLLDVFTSDDIIEEFYSNKNDKEMQDENDQH